MQINYEKVSSTEGKVTFTYTAEEVDAAAQQVYLKERKKIRMPGFRPGRAPRTLIERAYGKDIFLGDGVEEQVQKDFKAFLDEHDEIYPVDRPTMDIVSMDYTEGAVAEVTMTLKPEGKLGQIKGLTTTVTRHEISEEAVQQEIDREIKKQTSREKVTDRPAKDGDSVNIDYVGTVDGVEFEGGSARSHELVLGSNQFIPGFESQVVGMEIGEEKDLNVTFPEQYHSEELAGKDAVFHVTLNAITELKVPELDDELVQDISEYDTVDDFRAGIRARLEKQQKDAENAQVRSNLLNLVADEMEVEIPEAMIRNQTDGMIRNLSQNLAQYGMKLEQYLEMQRQTVDDLRSQMRGEAVSAIRQALALEAIAKQENIEVSDEEINEKIEENRNTYGESYARMLEENREGLKNDLVDEKALQFLFDNAEIDEVSDVDEEEEARAAANAAAAAAAAAEIADAAETADEE